MANKAVLAGASGLIGSELLTILLAHNEYDEVLVLVRKELAIQHKKLTQVVVDFENLDDYTGMINGHALFCCLGTTRKKTPDLVEYKKIDHDYPVKLAEIALKNGIQQYHLVSAMGASAKSTNFYSKFKGEVEAAITKVGLPCLHIYRPSLLTGNRKEHRTGEGIFTSIMKTINPLLVGSLKNYRSIPATTVASAMFKQSLNNDEGVFIHLSDKIKQIS